MNPDVELIINQVANAPNPLTTATPNTGFTLSAILPNLGANNIDKT
ncbi:hypothetical protein ES708_11591 [subsurface metagenome]